MTVQALLALGSNLGDRIREIHQGVMLLGEHPDIDIVEVSRLYETEPVEMAAGEGGEEPSWFINGAVCVDTGLSPEALLEVCLSIERRAGRRRFGRRFEESAARYGALSRQLDIDLLFYDGQMISGPSLTVPHPRLHERAFVLTPLMDIAPDWLHPLFRKTIRELYSELPYAEKVLPVQPQHVLSMGRSLGRVMN